MKVPDAVRDGDADSGLLAMSALCWVVRRMDLLTCALRRSVTSMDKVNVSGLKGLRNGMITFVKEHVALKRSGHVGVVADACDDDGEEAPSASQAVGVTYTVDDARGTSIGEPGGGVDKEDEEAGRAVTGTAEKHQDEDVHQDDNEDQEEDHEDREDEQEEEEEDEEEEEEVVVEEAEK
ncbi:unnamed protein product [Closterium sp. NIES-53]